MELTGGRTFDGAVAPAGEPAMVFLAAPDQAVEQLAGKLAPEPHPESAAVHLSGALPLAALAAPRAAGWQVGSLHPLQSFPRPRGPEAFRGSYFAVDASTDQLKRRLAELATRLGGSPKAVTDDQRALYHAAAAMGANYLVALAAESASVLQAIGWTPEESLRALLPLMRGVLQNLEDNGLPDALIGPIRRGDPATVRRHLSALSALPEQAAVYRILGTAALRLAREAGLDSEAAAQIEEALTG